MPALVLISISLCIFLLLKLLWFLAPEAVPGAVEWLALPASAPSPWPHLLSPVTYMFTHIDFWHLLINSLWLGWFSGILGDVAGKRWVAPVYLGGGVCGAVFYLAFSSVILRDAIAPGTMLLGASAATLALIAATIIITPGRRVTLAFIGTFPLKWIAAAAGMIFILASLEMEPGQTAAHLGGVAAGTAWGLTWLAVTRRKMQRVKQSARRRASHAALIQKVRANGYASLSRAERIALFNLSRHASGSDAGS